MKHGLSAWMGCHHTLTEFTDPPLVQNFLYERITAQKSRIQRQSTAGLGKVYKTFMEAR